MRQTSCLPCYQLSSSVVSILSTYIVNILLVCIASMLFVFYFCVSISMVTSCSCVINSFILYCTVVFDLFVSDLYVFGNSVAVCSVQNFPQLVFLSLSLHCCHTDCVQCIGIVQGYLCKIQEFSEYIFTFC